MQRIMMQFQALLRELVQVNWLPTLLLGSLVFLITVNQTRIYEVYYRVVRHGFGVFAQVPNYGRVIGVYAVRLFVQFILVSLAILVASANLGLMVARHLNAWKAAHQASAHGAPGAWAPRSPEPSDQVDGSMVIPVDETTPSIGVHEAVESRADFAPGHQPD